MKNKIKFSVLSLTILSSMNAFSYEAFDFFSLGMYGDIEYNDVEKSELFPENAQLMSTTNAYLSLNFKEKFKIYADYNYNTLDLDFNNQNIVQKNGDLYQAYLQYYTKNIDFKLGRFADYNSKGQNSLLTTDKLLKTQITDREVFGQSKVSKIDGVSIGYINPVYGGSFESTFYGGLKTQSEGLDYLVPEIESTLVGLNFNLDTNEHNFILGFNYSNYDEDYTYIADNKIKTFEEEFDVFSTYATYQYVDEHFFAEASYRYDYLDLKGKETELDEDENPIFDDQSFLDLKIGTVIYGFKPYIGYNLYYLKDNDNLNTLSFGVRYDYHSFGALIEASKAEQYSGDDVENIYFKFYYSL